MPKAAVQAGKVRLQFDFSSEAAEHMEEIRRRLDAGSKAEVMRRALRLLDYVTSGVLEGGEFVLRDSDGRERILEII